MRVENIVAASVLAALCLYGCGRTAAGGATNVHSASPNTSNSSTSAPVPPSANPRPGPFGITMGESISELKAEPFGKIGWYSIASPPNPSPDFPTVLIQAFPGTGVCFIKGLGSQINGDDDGAEARSNIDRIADALSTKYGQSRKIDYCNSDSSSCNPGYWTMHIGSGDRRYAYSWDLDKPINNIKSVFDGAEASGNMQVMPVVEYYSSNDVACKEAEKKASAAAL